jgi:hypothetical protein
MKREIITRNFSTNDRRESNDVNKLGKVTHRWGKRAQKNT